MTTDLRQRYDRDGYAVVEGLLTPPECAAFKRASAETRRAFANQEQTVYVGLAAGNPVFHDLVAHPNILAALTTLMDDGVAFISDKLVFKSAGKTFPTPWHIDRFYWPGTRTKLSLWLALDDVGVDDGALTVVDGSHRLALEPAPGDLASTNNEFHHVASRRAWNPVDERAVPIPQGAGIFFSDRLVHGSTPSRSGRDRWAWIGTYHAPTEDEPWDLEFPARRVLTRPTSARGP
ncbi:MAG TPA: phytanoyl-CoA dioxygenase family protein [Planctomycetota bacterium]|nr:phytanoyl-CoA dioxygenase family protein [Planctomycetota bacterium]